MKTLKTVLVLAGLVVGLAASAQVYTADVSKSEITWLGKKVTGQHNGSVELKSGQLELDGNSIAGGEFVIDMASIKVLDLEPGDTNDMLTGHLKSDDFFGVETYPEAKLVVKDKASFSGNKATVSGELTIKGITNPVTFDVTKDGENTYVSTIVVDRSKFDVRYGSGSFFDNLGDKMIYDEFEMGVRLVLE